MAVVVNSSAFKMTSDEMWEIKRVLEKRVKKRFSECLSPEGQLAMKMAKEDSKQSDENLVLSSISETPRGDNNKSAVNDENLSQSHENQEESFAKQSDDCSSPKPEGDIADDSSSPPREQGQEIPTGDKHEETTDTIERKNVDIITPNREGEETAIEETAKMNSVEKCMVWMEVNEEIGAKEIMDESTLNNEITPKD